MSYQGWANYPTWVIALWFDNDPELYEERRRIVRRALRNHAHDDAAVRYEVADALKEWAEESCLSAISAISYVHDLLSWALAEVDWRELAQTWIDEESEAAKP